MLDRDIAAAQPIIVGVGNGRRVFGVLAPVMARDFFGQARELFRRLGFAQGFDGLVGKGHAGIPLAFAYAVMFGKSPQKVNRPQLLN